MGTSGAGDAWSLGWVALGSIGTLGAVVVSIVLLWLQRRDLARAKEEHHRSQARGVHLWATEGVLTDGSYQGSQVRVSNLSTEPISIEACYIVHEIARTDENWEPWRAKETELPAMGYATRLLLPGEEKTWSQPEGFSVASFVGGAELVVLEFRDARGAVWWKKSEDNELRERYPREPWMSSTRRFLSARLSVLLTFLWWLSMRAIRDRPDGGPPLSWRLYHWISGGMGPEASSVEPITDRPPHNWADAPRSPNDDPRWLPLTLFVLPPRQSNDLGEEARQEWREAYDPEDPSTWALGEKPGVGMLWVMLKDMWRWRSQMSPYPALATVGVCLAGAIIAAVFSNTAAVLAFGIVGSGALLVYLDRIRRARADRLPTKL